MTRPTDWWVLDLDEDPTPGDPATVRSMATSWSRLADDAQTAQGQVQALSGDGAISAWIGEAGEAFRDKVGDLPGQLGQCHSSYRIASDALRTWAEQLQTHQSDADAALVKGRQARQDLQAAQARAASAADSVSAASGSSVLSISQKYAGSPPPASVQMPSASEVSAAQRRLESAQSAQRLADQAVQEAQGRLDAARQMALDARSLRIGDGQTAAGRIDEASDAGIPERSAWEKAKDWAAEAWKVIVEVAKVVVAVLGVVALIIGGPLAWVVFAAALIVLADTIYKYMQGKASLWDVALAALSCIPCTKGLTTLAALKTAFRSGGALGALGHIGASAKTAVVQMATMLRNAPSTAKTAVNAFADAKLASLDARFLTKGGSTAERWMSARTLIHQIRGGQFTAEGNLVIKRWTPAGEAGPLGTGFPADTFRSASYDEVLLTKDTTLFRVLPGDDAAAVAKSRGLFWTMDAPAGSLESQLNLALMPEWQATRTATTTTTLPQATHYVSADFPAGSTIFQGPTGVQTSTGLGANSIPGELMGGGEQVVPHPYFMRMWENAQTVDPQVNIDMNLQGPFPVQP